MRAPKLNREQNNQVKLNLVGIEVPSSEETEQHAEEPVLSDLERLMKELRGQGVKSIDEEDRAQAEKEALPMVEKPPPQESPERVRFIRAQEIARIHRKLLRLVRLSPWLKFFIPKAVKILLCEIPQTVSLIEWTQQVYLQHDLLCRNFDNIGRIRRNFIGTFYHKLCTELGLERKEVSKGGIYSS